MKFYRYIEKIINDIHHELRSPMLSIIALADIAAQKTRYNLEEIESIKSHARNMLALTDNLLNFISIGINSQHHAGTQDFTLSEILETVMKSADSGKIEIISLPDHHLENLRGEYESINKSIVLLLGFLNALPGIVRMKFAMDITAGDTRNTSLRISCVAEFNSLPEDLYELLCMERGMGVYGPAGTGDRTHIISTALCKLLAEHSQGSFDIRCHESGPAFHISYPVAVMPPSKRPDTGKHKAVIAGYSDIEASIIERQCMIQGIECRLIDIRGHDEFSVYLNACQSHDLVILSWPAASRALDAASVMELRGHITIGIPVIVTGVPAMILMQTGRDLQDIYPVMEGISVSGIGEKIKDIISAPNGLAPVYGQSCNNFTGLDNIRLLIVEDDPINRQVIINMARNLDIKIFTAATGRAALKALGRKKFDAALIDLNLPDTNGLELAARIRSEMNCDDIILIAITGDYSAKKQCLECGMNDFLPKPVEPGSLVGILTKWLSP